MGFLDRLFGNTASKTQTARPAPRTPQVQPKPEPPQPKPEPSAPPEPAAAAPVEPPAAPEVTAVPEVTTAAEEEQAPEETVAAAVAEPAPPEEAAPPQEVAPPPEDMPPEENSSPEEIPTSEETAVPTPADPPAISEHLQKRLDTYFARLRQDFPDGRIVRLNTGHKKLAERGAELRRLIGYEGRLDEFFALGGFIYQRSAGGRPTLPAEQTDSVEARLRACFPDDVPTTLAVQQADHRLYLDLRAAARRAGCTVGEYLNQFREA